MPASTALVPTQRASRYLRQLCSHGHQMSRIVPHRPRGHGHGNGEGGAPPAVRHTEWSETDGIIDFGWGRCTAHATDQALTLRAEAEDPAQLRRVQDGIARRLERIGRRDQLTVTWIQDLAA